MLSDMLQNAAEFPDETWEDEMFLRHLELTEDASYFEEEIDDSLFNAESRRRYLLHERLLESLCALRCKDDHT